MDQAPRGVNRRLVQLARAIGFLTLGGYVVLVLFAFHTVDAGFAAPSMTLFAGAKIVRDSLISFVRFRTGAAFSPVGLDDVLTSSLAGVLLIAAVMLQIWGTPDIVVITSPSP